MIILGQIIFKAKITKESKGKYKNFSLEELCKEREILSEWHNQMFRLRKEGTLITSDFIFAKNKIKLNFVEKKILQQSPKKMHPNFLI